MFFLDSRNKPQYNNNTKITSSPLLQVSRRFNPQRITQNQEIKSEPVVTGSRNNPEKIKWGPATWLLLHTLAYKVKDEYFLLIRNELLNNIVSICKNLPCPKCSTHASEYLSKINMNSIVTKSDLINFLFKFHNDVNIRTNSPQFPYEELANKYSKANTINIIQNFFVFFQDKTFNVSTITNKMHRERLIESLKFWFKTNLQLFDM